MVKSSVVPSFLLFAAAQRSALCFTPALSTPRVGWVRPSTTLFEEPIVSPFDSDVSGYTATDPLELPEGELLELTFDNVELVLDEMRPFLIQDGGNVRIDEIDGPVVRLQLEVGVVNLT